MSRKDCPYCHGNKCLKLCKSSKSNLTESIFTENENKKLKSLKKKKKKLKKMMKKDIDKSQKKEIKLEIKNIKKQIKKVKLTVAP